MSTIDNGGYAFPSPSDEKAGWHSESGMTLRDYFAAKFLAGAAATAVQPLEVKDVNDENEVGCVLRKHWDHVARAAYIAADAMIAARKAGA